MFDILLSDRSALFNYLTFFEFTPRKNALVIKVNCSSLLADRSALFNYLIHSLNLHPERTR